MRFTKKESARLNYIRDVFVKEDAGMQWIRERVMATDWPIQIGPEEGRLLQFLIHLVGAKKIVEIGTHAGYSSIWMARALSEEGHIYTIERDKNRARMARETFLHFDEFSENISLLEGKALEVLPEIEEKGPFDLVFIDADKLNYANYLDWAEKNVRKGGLIIGDNTFLSGAVYGEPETERISPAALKAMQTFNDRLGDAEKFLGIMLPTHEGWTMGIKL
jgi:caffeoyl-CoA O-methyltransferase